MSRRRPAGGDDAVLLRQQLQEGLPRDARRMAADVLDHWEQAIAAVPELRSAAAQQCLELLRLEPAERAAVLRRRHARMREARRPSPSLLQRLGAVLATAPEH